MSTSTLSTSFSTTIRSFNRNDSVSACRPWILSEVARSWRVVASVFCLSSFFSAREALRFFSFYGVERREILSLKPRRETGRSNHGILYVYTLNGGLAIVLAQTVGTLSCFLTLCLPHLHPARFSSSFPLPSTLSLSPLPFTLFYSLFITLSLLLSILRFRRIAIPTSQTRYTEHYICVPNCTHPMSR